MKRNPNIEHELKDLKSGLEAFPSETCFTVPEGYFEGLEQEIMRRIQSEKASEAPAAEEEIRQLSSVLSDIKHKNTYQVAPGFFERNEMLLTQRSQNRTAPIIRMSFRTQFMKVALAACFIGLIGFFVYRSLLADPHPTEVAEGFQPLTEEAFNRALEEVKEEEIIAYLDQHTLTADHEAIGDWIDESELPDAAEYLDEAVLQTMDISIN